MLRNLHIEGFKCFEKIDIELRQLTLLSGENSGGKSSAIQSLVLLAQHMQTREWGRNLLLDSPDLPLGTVADVLNQQSAPKRLSLGLTTGDETISWSFLADDRRSLSVNLDNVSIDGRQFKVTAATKIRHLLPADLETVNESAVVRDLLRLSWITAERTGPRELLPLKDEGDHTQVGHRGEWAAGILHWHGETEVHPALWLAEFPPTLFHQTRAHMQALFPGCDLRVTPVEGVNAVALRFRLDNKSDFRRPQNVGFGLSQLFPVIVAILFAGAGDCVLIENPEVHLHPRAQQSIGELIARVAATGVQVILETHSDHVLNGVRLAVKRGLIDHENVVIHFFGQVGGIAGSLLSPVIDADGRLDTWPDGFFDQLDVALSDLL